MLSTRCNKYCVSGSYRFSQSDFYSGEMIAEPIKLINPTLRHNELETIIFFLEKAQLPKSCCYQRYIF